MGTVFGKQSVAEPAFEVLLSKAADSSSSIPYEIRRYGTRFAAQVQYQDDGTDKDNGTPFRLLANYIGVFGTPENDGGTSINMTAPVVKQQEEEKAGSGTPIAMTAPVVKAAATTNNDDNAANSSSPSSSSTTTRIMQFILPAEYTSMDQIPKPKNPSVTIQQIPPAVGAVYRYSGSFDDERAKSMAQQLAQQLRSDLTTTAADTAKDNTVVQLGDEKWVASHYQFFGYNPPFTLPPFRRNEVWLPLTETQVEKLTKGFSTESAN